MKIIAELCQNHNGDFNLLEDMVVSAAENGADIIKIQTIKAKDFHYLKKFELFRPFEAEYNRLKQLELSFEAEESFIKLCRDNNVIPMTSMFNPKDNEYFNALGYDHLKISGYSMFNFNYGMDLFYGDTIFEFDKLYFSTSSLTLDEIARTRLNLIDVDATMLHCICVYPTPLEKLNLQNIEYHKTVKGLGHIKVGFSDHSNPHFDNLLSSKLAIFQGIEALERHYTLLPSEDTRDGKVSITPDMLLELRRFADLNKKEQYEELNKFTSEQEFNHEYYRKRLYEIPEEIY